MDIRTKRKKIIRIEREIESLTKEYGKIELKCNQSQCDENECHNCAYDKNLKNLESYIRILKEQVEEIKLDVDTWSYTIMGNKEAELMWWEYFGILLSYLNDDERALHPSSLPDSLICELIDRSYNELLGIVWEKKSRLAFQVLGVLLMKYGARMTEEVRLLILMHSKWEDEEIQFISDRNKEERKNYLLDFREKIESYREGKRILVPNEVLTEIIEKSEKDSLIDRDPINYRIN